VGAAIHSTGHSAACRIVTSQSAPVQMWLFGYVYKRYCLRTMSSPNNTSSSSDTESDGDILFTPDFNINSGIQPYRFEPVRDSESSSSSASDSDSGEQNPGENEEPEMAATGHDRTQDASSWCICDRCRTFPKVEECQCCQESMNVKRKLVCDEAPEDDSRQYKCITETPRFQWLVIDREALHVAGLTMSTAYGTRLPDPLTDE